MDTNSTDGIRLEGIGGQVVEEVRHLLENESVRRRRKKALEEGDSEQLSTRAARVIEVALGIGRIGGGHTGAEQFGRADYQMWSELHVLRVWMRTEVESTAAQVGILKK